MNSTIRNLIIAAPLATAALTMVPAAAMATEPSDSADEVVDTVELPNRIDAGFASEEQEAGLDVAWLFAGGLAVTASGVAFAVRRHSRGNA